MPVPVPDFFASQILLDCRTTKSVNISTLSSKPGNELTCLVESDAPSNSVLNCRTKRQSRKRYSAKTTRLTVNERWQFTKDFPRDTLKTSNKRTTTSLSMQPPRPKKLEWNGDTLYSQNEDLNIEVRVVPRVIPSLQQAAAHQVRCRRNAELLRARTMGLLQSM